MVEDGREFEAVVELVAEVDEDLETGRRHFRDVDGRLLGTLDEAVRAVLGGRMGAPSPPAPLPDKERGVQVA